MSGRALAEEQANAVWDVLVNHAGAPDDEWERYAFVQAATSGELIEWRFQGRLGFGGKFWNANRRWYVSTYPEMMTPAVENALGVTNAALAGLRASYEARKHALEDR